MKGRYWPLVGLGFGACQVVGLFMDDQPPTDGPAKDLATFYAGRFHLELIVAGFLVLQVWWVWSLLRFVPPSDYPP